MSVEGGAKIRLQIGTRDISVFPGADAVPGGLYQVNTLIEAERVI